MRAKFRVDRSNSRGRAAGRRPRRHPWSAALAVVCSLTGGIHAGGASASPGRLEINQACAVQTGCFAGDQAGFPVTINAPGSYYLTGNLTVAAANTAAIFANSGDFTLDLAGFQISGPVTCTGPDSAPVCNGNTGSGIAAGNDPHVRVFGGFVRGFGFNGIAVGDSGIVEDVFAEENGNHGILAGAGSTVRDVLVDRNEGSGIVVGDGSVVQHALSSRNGADGIVAGAASTITSSYTRWGVDDGIQAGAGSSVQGNLVTSYPLTGIEVGEGSLVKDNLVAYTRAAGIRAEGGTSVERNMLRRTDGVGINFATGNASTYRQNVFIENDTGRTAGVAVDMGGNSP